MSRFPQGVRRKRRQLLRLAALLAAAFPTTIRLGRAGTPRRVIVLGAGLAGLVAAYELQAAGHDVTVIEASARPGGRVRTLREPFTDGLHAEAGALFVPHGHNLTLRYARQFGLALQPALPLFESRLYYVRGRRVVGGTRDADWPFELTAEEKALGRAGLWQRYVRDALELVGDVTEPGWPSPSKLGQLDRMSAAEFLRSRGASAGAIALLRVGFLDMMADGIESYSALQMLQRVALSERAGQRYHLIGGGAERLVEAFARALAGKIRYRSPVVRIEAGEHGVGVVTMADGRHDRLVAERLICAVPFTALRRVDLAAPLTAAKRRAIQELAYTSVLRVFMQFETRKWIGENLQVLTSTDMPIQWLYEHTVNHPGRRGILEAQAVGAPARRLGALAEHERIALALSQVEQIYPGARAHYERGTTYSWDHDPWARGAFAYFRPGEMTAMLPLLAQPEGRVHFAGDHTSLWSGWMQGALESGLRAAREVAEAV